MSGPTFERKKKSAAVQSNCILCRLCVTFSLVLFEHRFLRPHVQPSLTVLYSPLLSCTRSHTASVRIRLYISPTVPGICASAFASAGRESGSEVESEERRNGGGSEARRASVLPFGEDNDTSYSPVYFTHTAGKSWQIGAPVSSVLACRHKLSFCLFETLLPVQVSFSLLNRFMTVLSQNKLVPQSWIIIWHQGSIPFHPLFRRQRLCCLSLM